MNWWLHFFPLYLRNHSRERRLTTPCRKKDFQVENGLVTGIAEGIAMTLRKPKLLRREQTLILLLAPHPKGEVTYRHWPKPFFALCLLIPLVLSLHGLCSSIFQEQNGVQNWNQVPYFPAEETLHNKIHYLTIHK